MDKEIIKTDKAPAAIGTYSQAIKVKADMLTFLSGQIPIDPTSGELIGGDFGEQAHQAFINLRAIIEESGGRMSNCVKINAYLTDLENFAEFNKVMAHYFAEPFPARAAVGVSSLPKNSLIEIEAIVAS
jgi:reactive intermediate/imine deaminase